MRATTAKTALLALWAAAALLLATAAGAAPVKVTAGGTKIDIPLPAGFVDTATAAPQLKQLG